MRFFAKPIPLQRSAAFALFTLQAWWWVRGGWKMTLSFGVFCALFWAVHKTNAFFTPGFNVALAVRSGPSSSGRWSGQNINRIADYAEIHAENLASVSRTMTVPLRASILTYVIWMDISIGWRVLLFLVALWLTRHAGGWMASREIEGGQSRRDHTALHIAESVRSGRPLRAPYYLYLRPFRITGAVRSVDSTFLDGADQQKHAIELRSDDGEKETIIPLGSLTMPIREGRSLREVNPEWEAVFEKAFRRFGRFMSLGSPDETIGAGRIASSEDDWWKMFVDLSSRASGFLIVPSLQPGTTRELGWLHTTRAFSDCIFVSLPEPAFALTPREIAPGFLIPDTDGLPALYAFDAIQRSHVVFLTENAYVTGQRPRCFITSAAVESALRELMPVARHQEHERWDSAMRMMYETVQAFARGKEALIALAPGLRETVNGASAELWNELASSPPLRIDVSNTIVHLSNSRVATTNVMTWGSRRHFVSTVIREDGHSWRIENLAIRMQST